MLTTSFNYHREFLNDNLKKVLRNIQDRNMSWTLLVDNKSKLILDHIFKIEDIYALQFKRCVTITKTNKEDLAVDKSVVVMMEIQENNFTALKDVITNQVIYLISINITISDRLSILKQSSIRKNIKTIKQINFGFVPFIDRIYQICPSKLGIKQRIQSLTSFLLSFEKFYQFQIHYPKSYGAYVDIMKYVISEKVEILKRHESTSFSENSSIRYRLIIIDRKEDMISPLVTAFYYGPALYELMSELPTLKQGFIPYVTSNLTNILFDMDFDEVHRKLDSIIHEKDENKKKELNLDNFDEAKKIIMQNYTPEIPNSEIKLHLTQIQTLIAYCQKRGYRCTIQHSLANGIDEFGDKMGSRDALKHIRKWLQGTKDIDEKQYLKVIILAFMVYNFWFFDKGQLLAAMSKTNKQRISPFINKNQGKFKQLSEKPSEKRMDYYRHMPYMQRLYRTWKKEGKIAGYETMKINESLRSNLETRNIFYMDGPMGYNQASFIRRQILSAEQRTQRTYVLCQKLLSTYQYMEYLLTNKYPEH